MRVTDITKRDQVVEHIQRNGKQLQRLQGELATGKKINKTSDDPIGATIIQDTVTTISRNQQIAQNTDSNIAWLELIEIELNHVADLLENAKVLALSQAGDATTTESRAIVAQELRSIRTALFDAANARSGKLYLFSGTETFTQPLRFNDPIQEAKIESTSVPQRDVAERIDLDLFKAQFEEHSSNEYRIRITRTGTFGRALYQVSDDLGETWSKEQILLPVIKVVNPDGKPDDQVILRFTSKDGVHSEVASDQNAGFFDFADSGKIFQEGLEFSYLPNPQIAYDGNSQKKEVLIANNTTVPISITAENLFLKNGEEGINVFGLLSSLGHALESDNGKGIADRIAQLDVARNQVLKQVATVGNTIRELEKAKSKLDDQVYTKQKRLSEVQDVDLAESMVELNSAELNNKSSLDAGGRLLQPTLLQFLR
ncbi:MAG: hypothetical protein HQM13_20325 [SAR324 cluster bacterium]|nr:hypothetical protein [SAR324 cluster bacterium]